MRILLQKKDTEMEETYIDKGPSRTSGLSADRLYTLAPFVSTKPVPATYSRRIFIAVTINPTKNRVPSPEEIMGKNEMK
jgi:hypothetical protein